MAGLYIHIPFCKQACHYCDFHFSTSQDSRSRVLLAIHEELRLQSEYLGGELINTVYFGGGTPSLLTSGELKDLLSTVGSTFTLGPDPEITLEANPDDLTPDKLSALHQRGINRLSIGIQSFDDAALKFLHRAHDSKTAVRSMMDARAHGFSNISIDLMYALPHQSLDEWKKNIRRAIGFRPEHISAYSLTIEEKTTFGRWQRAGKLSVQDEETSALHFEILMDMLGAAGYQHYEISNFCLPGFHSRHNSGYWNREMYLGAGPSAHSYDRATRQWNISNNAVYIKSIEIGKIPFQREFLQAEDKINEYILTTLRTSRGCDLEQIKTEFDVDLLQRHERYLSGLRSGGLITIENNILTLTRSGKLLADKIASDLFADVVTDR